MTTPNHIVGGLAITGITLSFWDINVFSESTYLATCIFASILPDIDHQKSIIGKIFFPISKYLDRNFGHRTITHSLSAFIPLILLVLFLELNFLNPLTGSTGNSYFLIFSFGYFSHLILDMLTIQGIPLFYPIMKNPCVIPANPSLRFRSGNLKSEAMALFFFTMILVSSYDLFANGFWTTYNRSFGSVKHISREFARQTNFIFTEYDFWKYDHHFHGEAFVINSDEFSTTLYKKDSLFTIDNGDNSVRNITLLPITSNIIYSPKELNFNFITIDSLNNLMNHLILKADITSNLNFLFSGKLTNKLHLDFKLHPFLNPIENDTLNNENLKIEAEINELFEKVYLARRLNSEQRQEKRTITQRMEFLRTELKTELPIYQKNKDEKELIELHKKLEKLIFRKQETEIFYKQIELLKQQKNKKNVQYFNGSILYLNEDIFNQNKTANSITSNSNP